MAYPPAPPLLLTRRLSSFLHSSLESLQQHKDQQPAGATLQTALLVTPSGKLLAYESPLPVRTLRTHCSVAASLWTIHASSSPSVAVALGQTAPINNHPQPPSASLSSPSLLPTRSTGDVSSPLDEDNEEEQYHDGSAPVSIAASFNGGAVFVVRRLRCGLLFACSTPSPNSSGSRPSTAIDPAATLSVIQPTAPSSASTPSGPSAPSDPSLTQSSLLPQTNLPILPPPPPPSGAAAASSLTASSSPTPINVPPKSSADGAGTGSLGPGASVRTTATSETYETAPSGSDAGLAGDADRDANADAASTTTTGTTTIIGGTSKNGSVAATLAIARRQVDELARLLDEKLGSLSVPEENIGINGFC